MPRPRHPHRPAAHQARGGVHDPEIQLLRGADHPGEPRLHRPDLRDPRPRRGGRPEPGAPGAAQPRQPSSRASSPAAGSSGSPSPRASSTNPSSSSSTSRRPASTRRPGGNSGTSCTGSRPRGSPSSSPPTTWTRPSGATGSRASPTATCSSRAPWPRSWRTRTCAHVVHNRAGAWQAVRRAPGQPGVEQVVPFGGYASRERARRRRPSRAIARTCGPGQRFAKIPCGLEDVFIGLMDQAKDTYS
jgi:hypothetical protein